MKTTIFLFSSLLAFNASAQMMVESTMLGQTLTTTKQGKVSACGIRVVGMPKPIKGANQRMFDASLNITADAVGIAKMNRPEFHGGPLG